MARLANLAVREASALVFSAAAAHGWCTLVFMLLGFSPEETAVLALPSILLSAAALLERSLVWMIPRMRPTGAAGGACTGFFLWASIAALWLHAIGEHVLAKGNAADMAFAGLALGVPSGLLVQAAAKAARNCVDALLRIL